MFLSISKLIFHRACLLQKVESVLSSQRKNPKLLNLSTWWKSFLKVFIKIFHLLKKDIIY